LEIVLAVNHVKENVVFDNKRKGLIQTRLKISTVLGSDFMILISSFFSNAVALCPFHSVNRH